MYSGGRRQVSYVFRNTCKIPEYLEKPNEWKGRSWILGKTHRPEDMRKTHILEGYEKSSGETRGPDIRENPYVLVAFGTLE